MRETSLLIVASILPVDTEMMTTMIEVGDTKVSALAFLLILFTMLGYKRRSRSRSRDRSYASSQDDK